MELNALLEIPVALPSHPRAVALLMAELSHAEPSLRRLTQIFGTDPALAARLLELANGPEFDMPRAVCGVPEALALVGIPQVRALVGSAPLGTTSRSVPGVNLQQFWRYSLHTAKMARSLAGVVRHNPMAGYTAGLLHGLGEPAHPPGASGTAGLGGFRGRNLRSPPRVPGAPPAGLWLRRRERGDGAALAVAAGGGRCTAVPACTLREQRL